MFVIHTDHHDRQAGVEKETSTNFRPSRSNVETISQVVSPKELFPNNDITLISTVDSANFVSNDISVEEVMSYAFKLDKDEALRKNKFLLGLVTNKLLLAFKNKPGFLETLVMECSPSLLNIYLTIRKIMKEKGFSEIKDLEKNRDKYIKDMSKNQNVEIIGNIISQYGAGYLIPQGSFDRYTPFRNNPDADFLVMAWPNGLLQASCNPFKKERELKGVNLGEIAQEVLSNYESELKSKKIPLSTIKWISELKANENSVGFTFKDFAAIYGEKILDLDGGFKYLTKIKEMMSKLFSELSENELKFLDKIGVNAWDFIEANSGGHKCITNISGLNYINRSNRPPSKERKGSKSEGDIYYISLLKNMQKDFVDILQEKINEGQNVNEIFKKVKNLVKESQPQVKFGTSGKVGQTPGIHIYAFNDKKIGHSNLLNFEDSWDWDSDIPMFYNNPKFCKNNCDDNFFNSNNSVYLHDLQVYPDFRGNGYGENLMEKSHEIAKNMGFDYVTLITSKDNEPAQNLYKKLGYDLHQTNGVKDFYYKKI